ncbi:MAG: UDP-N-acetylglucosamine 2-epimerase (hydrolyzing) [Desulfobacterales bacterium]|nr:MAG: UDP-N-acetylglucosamine 2-epimerase (hydrolyzing) [Desulfobacterales bacterium]
MRKIGVITVARSDYGIYFPVLSSIQRDAQLDLCLIVSGMHLSPEFGLTVQDIENDKFPIAAKVDMLLSSDRPVGISKSMGLGIIGFAEAYDRILPDILLVLGDRFEMMAATLAALPFKIPVAHIHGGELSEGAFDDALRHAMTKLSHLHFVATDEYARRVLQLGEQAWRITVTGAPGLDNLDTVRLLNSEEFEKKYNILIDQPPLLVTFHPVTLEFEQTRWQTGELLAALDQFERPIIFTLPNADTKSREIIQMITDFVGRKKLRWKFDNLGTQGYFSLMALSAAMVGNSSSGIVEAPSFELPVVNIGRRQQGRTRAANVIDVGYQREKISHAIKKAISPEFNKKLRGMRNPYRSGNASKKIVQRLKEVDLSENLIVKRFHDVDVALPNELS